LHPVYYRQDAGIAFTQLSKNGFFAASGETTDQIKKIGGAKMARPSSITMPSMMGIVGRAPAV